MKRLDSRAIDGPTSRTGASIHPDCADLATRIAAAPLARGGDYSRADDARFRDRPARLRRLEPGVFTGHAVEVALEGDGRAEQKHARLLAA